MNWDQPYQACRSPVCAENVVATSQPLAVQAGLDAMRRGGNAVDAALAGAIALTVVEPNNNGLGSDAFAILWDGSELVGLNASGRAPKRMTLDRFAGSDAMPALGWDSVTVPGAVSAWVALSERYGKLDFAQLFEAAIHYARDRDFRSGRRRRIYWQLAAAAQWPTIRQFRRPLSCRHRAPVRTCVKRPDMVARTLERIAAYPAGPSFYQR